MSDTMRAAYNESKDIISIHSWTDTEDGKGTPEEKARFKIPDYTCVGCGAPVRARIGAINTPHFAHKESNEGCRAGETLLHIDAKEAIKELGVLKMFTKRHMGVIIHGSHYVRFTNAIIEPKKEVTGSRYRPDLIATLEDGRKVWIEVTVTSETKGDKLQYIIDNDILCIEVNLKHVDRAIHPKELRSKLKQPIFSGYINNPVANAKCKEVERKHAEWLLQKQARLLIKEKERLKKQAEEEEAKRKYYEKLNKKLPQSWQKTKEEEDIWEIAKNSPWLRDTQKIKHLKHRLVRDGYGCMDNGTHLTVKVLKNSKVVTIIKVLDQEFYDLSIIEQVRTIAKKFDN